MFSLHAHTMLSRMQSNAHVKRVIRILVAIAMHSAQVNNDTVHFSYSLQSSIFTSSSFSFVIFVQIVAQLRMEDVIRMLSAHMMQQRMQLSVHARQDMSILVQPM